MTYTTQHLKTCQRLSLADHEATLRHLPVMDEEDATCEQHQKIISLLLILDAQLLAIEAPAWHRTICRELVANIATLLA